MGSPEQKQKIWEIISDIGTGMLVTEDDNILRSRPMQLVQDEYDGTLWFFTRASSDKTEEINQEHQVCVNFSDPKNHTFVSLSGRAKLTWDREKIAELWSATTSVWFPEGKDSNDCALLEIKINHGELWDSDVSKVGFVYEIAKAKLTNSRPNLGTNEKF